MYQAPIDDIAFTLRHIVGLDRAMAEGRAGDLSDDLLDAILAEAARFYSEWLPAGNYHLSYAAQAIAPGEFQVLPVHAEEMYDPDVFGQGVPQTLVVEERR